MQAYSYSIDSHGFFRSAGRNEHIQILVEEDGAVPYAGDTLLYLYCTRGTIHVELEGADPIIFHGMPTVRFFEGGLPLVGQYSGKVWVRRSSADAQVYAVFESYDSEERRALAYYSPLYDQNRGVKLRDPRDGTIYQILGRMEGAPMLEQLNGD